MTSPTVGVADSPAPVDGMCPLRVHLDPARTRYEDGETSQPGPGWLDGGEQSLDQGPLSVITSGSRGQGGTRA